jgi:hypothetical protein
MKSRSSAMVAPSLMFHTFHTYGFRYGTCKSLNLLVVPYLPHLPHLFSQTRTRTRAHAHTRIVKTTNIVWKVWKVWKAIDFKGFFYSIPKRLGMEGMELYRLIVCFGENMTEFPKKKTYRERFPTMMPLCDAARDEFGGDIKILSITEGDTGDFAQVAQPEISIEIDGAHFLRLGKLIEMENKANVERELRVAKK